MPSNLAPSCRSVNLTSALFRSILRRMPIKPEDLERLRSEAEIDERTMYRFVSGQSVRGDIRRRVARAAKRLRIVLPRELAA